MPKRNIYREGARVYKEGRRFLGFVVPAVVKPAHTLWHQIVGFGDGFAKLAERLVKGTHVFVQGELTTREYDRIIKVPNGKKVIEHQMKQLVVELKADTIRILDRSSNGEREAAEPQTAESETEVPY